MLSKIAYESQLENGTKPEKEQEQTKKGTSKKSKKSTMSLEEFNNLGNNSTQSISEKSVNSNGKVKGNFTFIFPFIINNLLLKPQRKNHKFNMIIIYFEKNNFNYAVSDRNINFLKNTYY